MGKKASHASLMTKSKKENDKQLNKLIKVMRPKVYITDSSSFKRLVQELTGNEPAHSPPPVLAPSKSQTSDDIEALDAHVQREPESSLETSFEFDASDASFDFCNQLRQSYDDQNHTFFHETLSDQRSMTERMDMVSYHNLESMLLLEMGEQYLFCNSFYDQIYDEDISIYDYELCGLL